MRLARCGMLCLLAMLPVPAWAEDVPSTQTRPAKSARELTFWLQVMERHDYTLKEMAEVTGLAPAELKTALNKLPPIPKRDAEDITLEVLPYPGGRHPRIGFLDGAIDPQRDTKLSVFLPGDPASYLVLDIPEAIWSNLGLTYLAHTHIPTVWSKLKITLPQAEWKRHGTGDWINSRTLPNGIEFGTVVESASKEMNAPVLFLQMWLKNGTDQPLTGLRVQNCVMLKGARNFNKQTNDNKNLSPPYAGVHHGKTQIVTGWVPIHRCWANPPCPCLHADPKFPDCPPGKTVYAHGVLMITENPAFEAVTKQLDQLGWQTRSLLPVSAKEPKP